MQQTATLAEHIRKRRTDLSEICDSKVESNKSLVQQANELSKADAVGLARFGNNFQITEELRKSPHLQVNFNQFLAEPLLREGSLLLDRCLQQRREFEELKTKWFEACVQIDELLRLNEITEREETEIHKKTMEIAEFERDSVKAEGLRIAKILKIIKDYLALIDERNEILYRYNLEKSGFQHTGQPQADFRQHEFSKYTKEKIPFQIQDAQQTETVESNKERFNLAEKNIKLLEERASIQKQRNDIARLVALRRAEQLINPSGTLNFREQMKPIWDRLQNDLAAAWFRLLAAAQGFQMLYDYPMDKCFDNSPKGSFNFDSLVTWCQNINTWLASFVDTQQLVTRSFSLKQLLKEQGGDFNAGLASGKWRFKLKENHFSNSKLVRLRGFAIQIDSGHFSGNWNIAISPPTKAILRIDESKIKSLEQKVGTLYLGRVNETTFQVIPESAAPPKLYNASPIGEDNLSGEWGIEILGMSTNEKPASSIQDIDIHLTVALV